MKLELTESRSGRAARMPVPRWLRILLWILLLLNMSVIFAMSSKTAEESTELSDAVIEKPMEVYDTVRPETAGDEKVYWWFQFIARKAAHVMEFGALCVWASGLLLAYGLRFAYPLGAGFTALYAVGDELHQLLVPGREGKVTDWLFDCLGSLAGILIVRCIVRYLRKRREGA